MSKNKTAQHFTFLLSNTKLIKNMIRAINRYNIQGAGGQVPHIPFYVPAALWLQEFQTLNFEIS
jgi:hypothetical protein